MDSILQWGKEILLIAVLVGLSAQDMKKKKISLIPVIGMFMIGIITVCMEKYRLTGLLFALMPGVFMLVFAKLSNEQVGYGDGLILLALGLLLNEAQLYFTLMVAMILVFCVSVVMLLTKKGTKKTTLPFVPFLTLSCLLSVIFV